MNNSDMPAMPQPIAGNEDGVIDTSEYDPSNAGLTKREHFAGLAMQGFIASGYYNSNAPVFTADSAVRAADALLAELNK
jgi:hypothetical protein